MCVSVCVCVYVKWRERESVCECVIERECVCVKRSLKPETRRNDARPQLRERGAHEE